MQIKQGLKNTLRWSERYARTDMIYAARGSFWLGLGKVIEVGISFVVMVAFANLIARETYGSYQFILSVAGILTVLSLPGMKSALVRSIARGKEGSFTVAIRTRMRWSLLVSVTLVGISVWYYLQGDLTLAGSFLVVALLFPFRIMSSASEFWQGRGRFDLQSLTYLIVTAGSVVAVVTALFLTDNLIVIVASFFAGQAVLGAAVHYFAKIKARNSEVDSGMVSYGKSLTLMGVIGTVSDHLDKVILFSFLNPVQLAIYSLAIDPIKKVKGFVPIKELALPKLSKHGVEGEGRKKRVFQKTLRLFVLTVPLAVLAALAAPYVYQIIFPQYLESVVYFQALSVLIATTPVAVLSASLVAEMKVRSQYVLQMTVPSLKIIMFLVLTPLWGVWGIIAALILSEFVRVFLVTYFFWRI